MGVAIKYYLSKAFVFLREIVCCIENSKTDCTSRCLKVKSYFLKLFTNFGFLGLADFIHHHVTLAQPF